MDNYGIKYSVKKYLFSMIEKYNTELQCVKNFPYIFLLNFCYYTIFFFIFATSIC
jgi:hypothetical protein